MASDAVTASTNANISATTRDFFLDTVVDEVFMKMPLLAKLLLRDQVTWKGGTNITRPVSTDELDSLAQSYTVGEPMTAGRKAPLTKPWFTWKYFQVPIVYTLDEFIQNGGEDMQVVDFAEYLTQKAQKAAKIKLYKMMYHVTSTPDTDSGFNSLVGALDHDVKYGHTTRTTTTVNKWFQGASMAETYADQDTAYTIGVNLFRRMVSACDMFVDDPANYLLVVGPSLYLSLKSQVDGSNITTNPGELVKYGFQSFTLDGIEVVKDPYLRAAGLTAETTPEKWAFLINVNDFELRLHPERSFRYEPLKWQGDMVDGVDEWLGRILVAGNLVCWRPNGSIWLSTVT